MTASTLLPGSFAGAGSDLFHPLRPVTTRQPLLAGAGLVLLLAMAPTLIAFAVDTRTLYGINIWTKPLKFQASVGLYLMTLAWFWAWLPQADRRSRGVRILLWTAAVTGLFEVGYITLQSARGVGSHFNVATPVESAMFALMGIGAVLLTATSGFLAWRLWRAGPGRRPRALHDAAVAGLAVTGVLGIATGAVIAGNGGHWAGGEASDAAGLAIVGWSRSGGDLRVAHFFAIHAMQILPVAGWLAANLLPERRARVAVLAATAAMVTLTILTLAQALAGQPFMAFIGSE